MRILIAEDDLDLQHQLSSRLKAQAYAVDACSDGRSALFYGKEYPFDAIILDLGLPGIDGVEILKRWRAEKVATPVLILTARGSWQDKVEGLEAGADDYLAKPFQMEELLARLNALLRRAAGNSSPELEFGPLRLDMLQKQVWLEQRSIELTAYEYNTLEYLALNRGKVISKTELTEHLYDQDFDRDSNVIEVFVGRLRKKLQLPGNVSFIKTIRGQGYRLEEPQLS